MTRNAYSATATTLRTFRASRNWSQGRLAAEAGVRQETISRIENGRQMTMRTAARLALALDIEPGLLIESGPDDDDAPTKGAVVQASAEDGPIGET